MILQAVIRKILLYLAPLVLFYLLRRIGKKRNSQKPHHSFFEKSNIVEGKIIKE